ncbi:MAG: hypothetical protein AVDCRST_MAG73-2036 [uncultured Thermomicrobiales bacterium]|uniref:Uncharacterized protein n=1 Tax=uncultured Thermomicrobiales bacterium TaxID=1645740 RepID=A0A6J4U912_9BACT|nr:MAG: hypothetical protein AVDCRST_MAG73-2036 [uncultured Thermomicrobiales bacterium]
MAVLIIRPGPARHGAVRVSVAITGGRTLGEVADKSARAPRGRLGNPDPLG